MKFDAYANVCVPEQYVVLGLKLKPLSLGHYLLMRRFGCAYASDTETNVTFGDLVLGVLICSMTFNEALEFFNLPPIKFMSWRNLQTLGFAYVMARKLGTTGYEIRCWGNKFRKQIKKKNYNMLDEFKHFQRYIVQGSSIPNFYPSDNNSDKQSGAHWSIGLHSFLLSKYTEEAALNLSLSRAFLEYCKWAEEQGALEFLQDYEEEMIA